MWKPLNLSAEDDMIIKTEMDSAESVAEADGIAPWRSVAEAGGTVSERKEENTGAEGEGSILTEKEKFEDSSILPGKEKFEDNGKEKEAEKEVGCKINEKKNKDKFGAEYGEDTDYVGKSETRCDGEIEQAEKGPQEGARYGLFENSSDAGDGGEKEDGDEGSVNASEAFVKIALKSREQARREALIERKHVIETKHFTAIPENPDNYGNVNVRVVRPVFKIDIKKDDEIIEISRGYGDSTGDGEEFDPSMYEMSDKGFRDIFSDDDKKGGEGKQGRNKKSRLRRFATAAIKEIAAFVLIFMLAVVLVGTFNIYVRRSNVVVGSSMEPTLYEGYSVYSTLLPYVFGEPEIGDIVIVDVTMNGKKVTYFHLLGDVLKNNRLTKIIRKNGEADLDVCWVKRVVGVAGDVITFEDDQFYRNGEPVREDYIKNTANHNYPVGTDPIVVPEGYVFVMGDNRGVSRDSRSIGCVPIEIIIGKMTSYKDNNVSKDE